MAKLSSLGVLTEKHKCMLCGKKFTSNKMFDTTCRDCKAMMSTFSNRTVDKYQFFRDHTKDQPINSNTTQMNNVQQNNIAKSKFDTSDAIEVEYEIKDE